MKIYLSARYRRKAELAAYADLFRSWGHEITSTWLGPDDTDDSSFYREYAIRDFVDIDRADFFLSFDEGHDPPGAGGRLVELGYALAKRKTVALIGVAYNTFHFHPSVWHYGNIGRFVQDLMEGRWN